MPYDAILMQHARDGTSCSRIFHPEKDAVQRRHIVEGKHAADTQSKEHDGCHAVKKRITVDDQRQKAQHGG